MNNLIRMAIFFALACQASAHLNDQPTAGGHEGDGGTSDAQVAKAFFTQTRGG